MAAAALRAFGEKFVATAEVSRDELVVPAELLLRPLEELRCAMCMEFPMAPWVLSCDHSFCKECLDAHKNSGGLKCPVCRAQTVGSMKFSRPLRAHMTSAGFRCYEPGCFWQGHSYESAKRHWADECALVKAVRAELEMQETIKALREKKRVWVQIVATLSAKNVELELEVARRKVERDNTVAALEAKNMQLEVEASRARRRCREILVECSEVLANSEEAAPEPKRYRKDAPAGVDTSRSLDPLSEGR
jgi:hypothetical protein